MKPLWSIFILCITVALVLCRICCFCYIKTNITCVPCYMLCRSGGSEIYHVSSVTLTETILLLLCQVALNVAAVELLLEFHCV